MKTIGVIEMLSVLAPLSILVLISMYANKLAAWLRKIRLGDK